jgi:hypothetical protein
MKQAPYVMTLVKLIGEEPKVVPEKPKTRHVRRRRVVRRGILGRVRRVFAFLLVATVLVFAFCRREDLQDYLFSGLHSLTQEETQSSAIRNNALDHEKEVNQVLDKK